MDIHKLTKLYLIITLLLVVLNLWKIYKVKPWKRVYYGASVGIAKNHPVDLYAKITQNGKAVFKPSLSDEDNFVNWGDGSITDVGVINELLPDSLILKWVSLRERNIYGGTFKLPTKKIEWYYKNKKDKLITDKSYYYPTKIKKYFNFDIGVAPEGEITVWIVGDGFFRKEIAHFKANEIDTYHYSTIREIPKQESIETALQDYLNSPTSYQYDSIIKNKLPPEINKWKNYQKKFTYYVVVKDLPKDIFNFELETFNKEMDIYSVNEQNKWLFYSGAPKHIKLKSNKKRDLKFEFDDDLISIFRSKEKALFPNDTLVFLLKGNGALKDVSSFLTSVNEIKSESK